MNRHKIEHSSLAVLYFIRQSDNSSNCLELSYSSLFPLSFTPNTNLNSKTLDLTPVRKRKRKERGRKKKKREREKKKYSERAKAVKGLIFAGRTVIAAAFAQSVPEVRRAVPAHSRQTDWICDCLSGPSSLL